MARWTSVCVIGTRRRRRYPDPYSANTALDAIWRFALNGGNRSDKLPCRSYYCDHCKGYHLTSKPKDSWRGGMENVRDTTENG